MSDVDGGFRRERVGLDNSHAVCPVFLLIRRVRIIDNGNVRLTGNVDRIMAERPGGIAFIIFDTGRVKRTAHDVQDRIFEPTGSSGEDTARLVVRHICGVQIIDSRSTTVRFND